MFAIEMSTTSFTLRAGLVASAAVVLLALSSRSRRLHWNWWRGRTKRPAVTAVQVVRMPIADYQKPRWWERFAAITGIGVITAVLGAIMATFIAVGLIWAVTTMTGLLK